MTVPAYELKIVKDESEKPLKIEVKVELPGINSVSLCDLSVSEVSWVDNVLALWYIQGIVSKSLHGYKNPQMLKPFI